MRRDSFVGVGVVGVVGGGVVLNVTSAPAPVLPPAPVIPRLVGAAIQGVGASQHGEKGHHQRQSHHHYLHARMLLDSWGGGYGPPPLGNSVVCSLFHGGWT